MAKAQVRSLPLFCQMHGGNGAPLWLFCVTKFAHSQRIPFGYILYSTKEASKELIEVES
jgi:hypothetical protein